MVQKFLKPGKVVLVLNGRFAGRKAVIVHNFDEGGNDRSYGHAMVAGIDRYPLKVTRAMNNHLIHKRTKIRPFIRFINYQHLMPTRYNLDAGKDGVVTALRTAVTVDSLQKGKRVATRKAVRKIFEERHKAGKNAWFF